MSEHEPNWQAVATVLYAELSRWGFGDFHYGDTPRDPDVLAALAVYDRALEEARLDGSVAG